MRSDRVGIMQPPTPIEDLDALALNVPTRRYEAPELFQPDPRPGGTRYRHTLASGQHIESLLVAKESDALLVSLHGAIDRKKYSLPRFERFRTLRDYPASSLYVGDPALWNSEDLELAWFTGWSGYDFYPVLAQMITATASAIGAEHVIINGGSGGGFAALQVSALVPGSVAVAYNPQTSIYRYLHPRWPHMPQKRYLRHVWPELEVNDLSEDWTAPLGERLSAVKRYSISRDNRVVYMINQQDEHHISDHLEPFRAAHANADALQVIEYDGGSGHNPTTPAQFRTGLVAAAEWSGFSLD